MKAQYPRRSCQIHEPTARQRRRVLVAFLPYAIRFPWQRDDEPNPNYFFFSGVGLSLMTRFLWWIRNDPNSWNSCPGNQALFDFAKRHESSGVTFHGYLILHKNRNDKRLTVEGLELPIEAPSDSLLSREWEDNFRHADEFTSTYFWYD